MHASTSSSSCSSFPIPKNYKILRILGEGSFGTVMECVKKKTEEIVAVKVNKHDFYCLQWEAFMMRILMAHNLENSNIVKYEGEIFTNWTLSLVFEMLDSSLQDYLAGIKKPMRLENIRTVIQQMAVAFAALKRVGVIHTDVKIDNIMMVDHARQPFRVKLIDFGLAIFRWQTKLKTVHQAVSIVAPEIMLGLPVSEAIDIWSLGCAMGIMLFGVKLFPANFYYEELQYMTELLGAPPAYLLNAGSKSDLFFKKIAFDSWRLKRPAEVRQYFTDHRRYSFRSLDTMKTEDDLNTVVFPNCFLSQVRLEMDNPTETDERRECIDLLKAMLQWDPEKRITPDGILNHPFITKSYLNSISELKPCNEPGPSTSKAQTMNKKSVAVTHFEESSSSEGPPRRIILVRPANPRNRIHSEPTLPRTSSPASASDTTSKQSEKESPPITSNHHKDRKEKKKEKEREKLFKRFYSWMKKKMGPKCCVDIMRE